MANIFATDEIQIQMRTAKWNTFFEKTLRKGEKNDEIIPITDIPAFAPKVYKLNNLLEKNHKKLKNNEAFPITNIHRQYSAKPRSLQGDELAVIIEKVFLSDLKKYLIKRSISKLLQNNKYDHYHKNVKREVRILMRYLTKDQVKEYIYCCYNDYDITNVSIFLNNHSILKKLFTKREQFRNNKTIFFKINNEVYKEWNRMSKIVAPQYLFYYVFEVLKSI